MGIRTETVNETFTINLTVQVNLKSLSNYRGFINKDVLGDSIKEFAEEIQNILKSKLEGENQTESLLTCDFANYDLRVTNID